MLEGNARRPKREHRWRHLRSGGRSTFADRIVIKQDGITVGEHRPRFGCDQIAYGASSAKRPEGPVATPAMPGFGHNGPQNFLVVSQTWLLREGRVIVDHALAVSRATISAPVCLALMI